LFRKVLLMTICSLVFVACTPKQVLMIFDYEITREQAEEVSQNVLEANEELQELQRNFLRLAYELHHQTFLVCTRAHESDTAGGYLAVSSSGTYRGAYQFHQNTWDNVARHSGWYWLEGVDPITVSVFWQDMMAWYLYQLHGNSPWGGRC